MEETQTPCCVKETGYESIPCDFICIKVRPGQGQCVVVEVGTVGTLVREDG